MKQITTCLLVLFSALHAQSQTQTHEFHIQRAAVSQASHQKADYAPSLYCVEKPVPGGMQEVKKLYQRTSRSANEQRSQNTTLPPMMLGKNFYGNAFASATPNDNDMAISNGGTLISVINSTLFYYNTVADTLLATQSYSNFTTALGLPHQEFDPKVLYDPNEDKFVTVVLNGYTDTTSSIIVGFSQTNDPLGAWNLYSLPGNPLNNGLWTDYPMISLTDKELFITVNLLYPDSSWQTGFNETIIWQVKKQNGFSGNTLTTAMHNNIQFNGRPIRNLCPVRGGSQLYGPDMYFVSNRNFETQGDTFFLVRTTDTIGAAGFAIEIKQMNSNADYFLAGDARQSGTHLFATNDSRVLGAFYEDNQIQFVHNCMDTNTTFCSVYHGIITNLSAPTPTVMGQIISDTIRDLGYPNIAYAGHGAGDHAAVIGFDHTAPTVNPGCSAIKSDGSFNYTPILKIANGSSPYVNVLSAAQERWGDYSGIQTRYNNPGEIWMSGYYAYQYGVNRFHRAYIGQILADSIDYSHVHQTSASLQVSRVYPNPSTSSFHYRFELEKAHYLQFDLYDLQGRKVSTLMREWVRPGTNEFTFRTTDLAPGTYILKVWHQGQVLFTERIIKQ